MSERDQHNRWRCTVVGCNPVMKSLEAVETHQAETGHRTAKWPIRSAAGKARARQRNKTGYYDKYNVGAKSRGGVPTGSLATPAPEYRPNRCLNQGDGLPVYAGGEFYGFEEGSNCGECDWCEDNDTGGEYAFGEDDF